MGAILTEGQPGIKGLRQIHGRSRFGEIGHLAGLDVEHRDRLLITRLEGTVAGIHHRQVAPIRGNGGRHGQAVQSLGRTGNGLGQPFAGGQVDLSQSSRRHKHQNQRNSMTQKSSKRAKEFITIHTPLNHRFRCKPRRQTDLRAIASPATLVLTSMNNCHYKTLTNGSQGPLLGSKLTDPAVSKFERDFP